jgi:hypothetical protein
VILLAKSFLRGPGAVQDEGRSGEHPQHQQRGVYRSASAAPAGQKLTGAHHRSEAAFFGCW